MTIASFTDLKAAIASYTYRTDLTGRDVEFIANVESIFNRRLSIGAQEATATGNTVAGTATILVPTGFIAARTLTFVPVAGVVRDLVFITLEQAEAMEFTYTAEPRYYTFATGLISLYPTPDKVYAYTLRHYASLTPLSGSNATNYLLTNYPDLYLYGCLAEAFMFLQEIDTAAKYKGYFETLLKEVIRSDAQERFPTPPLVLFEPMPGNRRSNSILTDEPR